MKGTWFWSLSAVLALLLFGLLIPWPSAGATANCGPPGKLPVMVLSRPGAGYPFVPLDEALGAPYIDPAMHRTFVPLRALFEALSPYDPNSVQWDEPHRTALFRYGGKVMTITYAGSSTRAYSVTINGQTHNIHTFICEGRIYAPVRYISEAFHIHVDYYDGGIVTVDPVQR